MHIVYWAHSYREEDASVNRHFGVLIEQAERMIVNFDPPSETVSEAKLQQNRRSCDGMVAVLTWRATGPSKYILFEIGLALRARMPVMVFVDDRLTNDVLPTRVLQQRFSHRTYFRQVREHIHALRVLKDYMGDPPPTKYQPNSGQRCCGILGLSHLSRKEQNGIVELVSQRGYHVVNLERVRIDNPLTFDKDEYLAVLDVVLRCADSKSARTLYWSGAISAASIPSIAFTVDSSYKFQSNFPMEFQPRLAETRKNMSLEEVITNEFDLFEQNFLSAQDPETIDRYVKMQLQAGTLAGNYETSTRQLFIGAIMGDQYNVSGQSAAVGPNAHAHDISFNQIWNQFDGKLDLPKLAEELAKLRETMGREASEPEQLMSVGSVAAAEKSARQNNGPKTMEYLKTAGKWAFGIAEKIGLDLAKEALKGAIGM